MVHMLIQASTTEELSGTYHIFVKGRPGITMF